VITDETIAAAVRGCEVFRTTAAFPDWFATLPFAARHAATAAILASMPSTDVLNKLGDHVARYQAGRDAMTRLSLVAYEETYWVYQHYPVETLQSFVDAKYAALLDGYDVRRAPPVSGREKTPIEHHPIVGFDERGTLQVIVMPLRERPANAEE